MVNEMNEKAPLEAGLELLPHGLLGVEIDPDGYLDGLELLPRGLRRIEISPDGFVTISIFLNVRTNSIHHIGLRLLDPSNYGIRADDLEGVFVDVVDSKTI